MAQNLFVRADEREALLGALERLVAAPEHQADGDGLVAACPPLIVGPACDGWIPLGSLRGWVGDVAALGRALSAAPGISRVVSSEVLGACYQLRHLEHRSGEQVAAEILPPEAWQAERLTREYRGPMPLYRDVEQLAYALLLDLGVPPAAALLGVPPLEGDKRPLLSLGEGTALCWAGVAGGRHIDRRAVAVSALRHEGDDAPVVPRQVAREHGLCFFDERFVEGAPSAAAMTRLLQLEDKILERGRRLHGSRLDLSMTYYNACFQDELDAQLVARGRHVAARAGRCPTPPWWQFWRFFGRFG